MKLALAQVDALIGDFEGNAARVLQRCEQARAEGCRLVVFPELALCGYPPKDYLDSAVFAEAALRAALRIAEDPRTEGLVVVLGLPERHDARPGRGLYNAAAVLEAGNLRLCARKSLLPFYDVFDEPRWFDPAPEVATVEVDGLTIGLSICEDLWNDDRFWAHRRYTYDPVADLVARGADLILNLAASPFHRGKPALRARMVSASAARYGVQIVSVNAVGGQDALIFDGHSLAAAADGRLAVVCRGFEEDFRIFDTAEARETGERLEDDAHSEIAQAHAAIVCGIRDYFRKTGFEGAVIGLSGGIDSSVVAALATEALGPEHVTGLLMPSRYSSEHSLADAEALAEALGIRAEVVPIVEAHAAIAQSLGPALGAAPPGVVDENLQARLRGLFLMAFANAHRLLVLATGNKSELAMGYATLYGDMCGALLPIGDLTKMRVYALGRHINASAGRPLIPERVFEKPPSAELRPGQTDQDTLPPYPVLDAIVEAYVERREDFDTIVAQGIDPAVVKETLRRLTRAEYKRRQAAPILKLTPRAFGEGWRMPLAHGYRPWLTPP
ncbi:MAG: NAD+ synthase [Deltaproteobacteria bacterium]|nr:MAG: NAD+ synthase [Deltaproteobacteria bacterium]